MSSFGSGFASGLGQGMAMGKMLMDTYNENKLKRDVEDAQGLDQTVIEGGKLTANQQATLDHVSNADNGYEVQKLDNGTVRFRTAGSENGWEELTPAGKQFKLGNVTRDTEFTKDEISRARHEAIADAYMKNGDPAKALGFKNAAREDRTASAIEAAREEYVSGLEDMASGKNYDKYVPMILRSYNDPRKGSKHDDGHTAVYDPERNVVAFSNKDGQIVNTIPVNQETMTTAWKERYRDKLEAYDPKLGLQREELGLRRDTLTETTRHNKAAEGILSARNSILGGGGGKPNVGRTTITETDDQGVTTKTPVSIVTTMKNGVPVVQAYRLDGTPVTDKKALNQIGTGDDGGLSTSGRNADLGAARKAFESGNMDYTTYQNTQNQINQAHDRKDALVRLDTDFKTVEKKDGRDAAVRSVVAQVEGSIKNPKDKEVVYGQLGIKPNEILNAKRDKTSGNGLAAATNYSSRSTWQPGQRRVPENMQGQ